MNSGGATGLSPDAHPSRRRYTKEDVVRLAERYRSWGRWGNDDELGAANHVTPERVAAAARLIRKGRAFSLAMPIDRSGPQQAHTIRCNPQHVMLRTGMDVLTSAPAGSSAMASTDDAIYMPLQAATQWDALCHVFFDGRTYNGRGPETVTAAGATHNSITNIKDRAVGRAVLLDMPRLTGRDWLEPGEAIQDEDLSRCADTQNVEVGRSDFVLVRTGHLERRRRSGSWGDFAGGPAPGLGVSAAHFLCGRDVTAVATDTWGMEVVPFETGDALRFPLHVILLVNAGIYIGEMWDFEALAADCAADGCYEFFLCAAPLTITGSVGSPINPLALK